MPLVAVGAASGAGSEEVLADGEEKEETDQNCGEDGSCKNKKKKCKIDLKRLASCLVAVTYLDRLCCLRVRILRWT